MANFPGLLLLSKSFPEFLVLEFGIVSRMELIQVDAVSFERFERRFQLFHNFGSRECLCAIHEAVEAMTKFRGDDPFRAISAREIIADETFRQVIAVTFGGIDEIDAELRAFV